MAAPALAAPAERLGAWAAFAGVLAAAGCPSICSHPAFYAETYGLSLQTLGLTLLFLRVIDVVQDPALGWLAERLGPKMPWPSSCRGP